MNGQFTETLERGILRYSLPGMPGLSVQFQGKVTEPIQGKIFTIGSAHGSRVDVVTADYKLAENSIDRPDGFVTQLHKTKLVAKVADCATVLLVHEQSGTVGLAHAGWRGARAGVVQNLVSAMGQNAGEMYALVTPYVDGALYDVHVADVEGKINLYAEFAKVFPKNVLDVVFTPHKTDKTKAYLDVGLAIQYALMTAGVPENNITISEHRTMSEEMFWSARLQHNKKLTHNSMCVSLR